MPYHLTVLKRFVRVNGFGRHPFPTQSPPVPALRALYPGDLPLEVKYQPESKPAVKLAKVGPQSRVQPSPLLRPIENLAQSRLLRRLDQSLGPTIATITPNRESCPIENLAKVGPELGSNRRHSNFSPIASNYRLEFNQTRGSSRLMAR